VAHLARIAPLEVNLRPYIRLDKAIDLRKELMPRRKQLRRIGVVAVIGR
jgi:hypothetical protein